MIIIYDGQLINNKRLKWFKIDVNLGSRKRRQADRGARVNDRIRQPHPESKWLSALLHLQKWKIKQSNSYSLKW